MVLNIRVAKLRANDDNNRKVTEWCERAKQVDVEMDSLSVVCQECLNQFCHLETNEFFDKLYNIVTQSNISALA